MPREWYSSKSGLNKRVRELKLKKLKYRITKLKQTKRAKIRRGSAHFCKYSIHYK